MPIEMTPGVPIPTATMREKVHAHPWQDTPLGPIADWPAALRIAVDMVLASKFPQCLAWGSQLITLYNDAFRPILGNKPEALGRPFSEVWSEAWEVIGPFAEKALAGHSTFIEDFPLNIDRHGFTEQAFFTFCYSPVHDENGVVVGMKDTVIEVTGKVNAERQLLDERRRQEELNATLERRVAERTRERDRIWQNARDLLVVIGDDGLLRAASPSWVKTLGQHPRGVVGRPFLDSVHPDDVEPTRAHLEGSRQTRFQNRCLHVDGSLRWVSWYLSFEADAIYAYGRDISEERQQAGALAQAEEQLRQAQKMEAVGQLTGGIAHDFNNLLAGIIGNLELLQGKLVHAPAEQLERYITAALGAANRAAGLTHRLLAFSRRQTLDARPTDVNQLIAGMEDLIKRTMGPAIEVQFQPAADSWIAMIDPNQLESALLNLAINARDAMPAGGHLHIATANRRIDAHEAHKHELSPGEYLTLSVTDNGTGMSAEVRQRAFDPFFTTKPTGKGTGLGLSMIYGFARQSGGQIHIDSTPGQGSCVNLYLPRVDRPSVADDSAVRPAGEAPSVYAGEGETVLVIDDEPTLRQLIVEILQELGYRTIEAADGPAGLRILQSDMRIDLLVSDVGLPGGMNGRQVADAGRQLRPGLKVLFITGYAESNVLVSGDLELGMQILTKPFDIDVLAQRIRGLVEMAQGAV